jgi:SNF2 family DNA or RNA helicase
VLAQLPQKLPPQNIGVILTNEQKKIYNQLRDETYKDVEGNGIDLDTLPKLTRLKQVCMSLKLLGREETVNPKLNELRRLFKEELSDMKVIIFTQYVQMAKMIAETLKDYKPLVLTGEVKSKDRAVLETTFNEDPSRRIFITTTAGGMGLNLQAGQAVVNYDYLWNPAAMEQIADRCVRIDSKNKFIVMINLVAVGSIEEKILDMLAKKQALSDAVVDGSEDAVKLLKWLTKEEVLGLIEDRYEMTDLELEQVGVTNEYDEELEEEEEQEVEEEAMAS